MNVRFLAAIAGLGLLGLAMAAVLAQEAFGTPTPVPAATPPVAPVVVRGPTAEPRAFTGERRHDGTPATIACGTCHTTRPPNRANRSTADLDEFHQGLRVAHGNAPHGDGQVVGTNSCLSCHNPDDYGSLRLADGTRVAFTDSIQLCSQCHGPQRRDYEHGAHGGMNGHWDLSRGGRLRNACVQCHDPHTPKYQLSLPMPPPRDRFAAPGAGHE
jgi:hypothetical protein